MIWAYLGAIGFIMFVGLAGASYGYWVGVKAGADASDRYWAAQSRKPRIEAKIIPTDANVPGSLYYFDSPEPETLYGLYGDDLPY